MKPAEKKPEIVYRIIDCAGNARGSSGLSYHSQYDFNSAESAREANIGRSPGCKIAKYRVTYELLSEDVEHTIEEKTNDDR